MMALRRAAIIISALALAVSAEPRPRPQASAPASAAPAASTPGACSPLELVVARGTTEPGVLGIVVGDPLLNATQADIQGATGYAVNYPASTAADSESKGVADVLAHMKSQTAACPDQKFALVGYSQGAAVMHTALTEIQSTYYPKIVALVMFGDPGRRVANFSSTSGGFVSGFPADLGSKLKENCEPGDPVCTLNGTMITSHISYGDPGRGYMPASASYIARQLKSDGQSGAEPSTTPIGTGSNAGALQCLGALLGNGQTCSSSATAAGASGAASGTAVYPGTMTMPGGVAGATGSGVAVSGAAGATGSGMASRTGSGATASGAAQFTGAASPLAFIPEYGHLLAIVMALL